MSACRDPTPPSSCSACSRTTSSRTPDRKSTRLNSSHSQISYAVFCLKKKKCIDRVTYVYGEGEELSFEITARSLDPSLPPETVDLQIPDGVPVLQHHTKTP